MAKCFDGGKKLVRILDSQQACALDGRIPRRVHSRAGIK
ncbi:Uncharacterised protein [Salmonella enterica subsp. enterica serovar Bovismorbificans]|uniref:Uncharacterized protein n=1 Tax=Salmonella enterica subsp. enterica serovar Bovismorbificans TaxID=58097 RepID=A0A655EED2_SALET|nr:Uncharacterised protein [Salmonella enterica subsp. enterica serovar Bovismorbificans]